MPKFEVTIREDVFVKVVVEARDEDALEQFLSDEMEGKVADLAASKMESQVVEERYIRVSQLLTLEDPCSVDHVVGNGD